jgi:NitT/TauT family transport system substrate-binding protein
MRFVLTFLFGLLPPAHALAFTIVLTEPTTPLTPTSVIELAQQLGYFTREGVDVQFERVNGTPLAIAALSAGQGDMAEVSVESLLKLTARGDPRFRAISSPARSLSYVIVARDGIDTLQGLRNRQFGIGQAGTLDDTLTRTVLRNLGLDPGDLNIVSIGQPPLRLKALKAGKIDATTVSYGSWTTLPDKTGLHLLLPKEEYFRGAPVIAKVNVVSTKTLRDKHAEVVKVTAALLKIARDFARDPQGWATAMAQARRDVPAEDLQALAKAYARDWCIDGCFEERELRESARLFFAQPAFTDARKPALTEWADFSVLDEVMGTVGRAPH